MAKFNTKKLSPTNVVEYQIPEIAVPGQEGVPTLLVRYAGKGTPFQLAIAKASATEEPMPRFPTPEQRLESDHAASRSMRSAVPGNVVMGWKNVYQADEQGQPVATDYIAPFCAALFAHPEKTPGVPADDPGIPEDMFASFMGFVLDAKRFRSANPEAMAKN